MQDVSHLFEILREINSLTTYITDNHNTDILTTENYKIISASDPSKIMKCFDNGWTLYGQCSCRMDSCQKCCELNTWKMLTTSNKIKAKIIGFSVPEQKIIILEIFHDFIDKQNRLNTIYEKYGTSQQIYDKLDKIYEEKTKPKINTNNQKKEEQHLQICNNVVEPTVLSFRMENGVKHKRQRAKKCHSLYYSE